MDCGKNTHKKKKKKIHAKKNVRYSILHAVHVFYYYVFFSLAFFFGGEGGGDNRNLIIVSLFLTLDWLCSWVLDGRWICK